MTCMWTHKKWERETSVQQGGRERERERDQGERRQSRLQQLLPSNEKASNSFTFASTIDDISLAENFFSSPLYLTTITGLSLGLGLTLKGQSFMSLWREGSQNQVGEFMVWYSVCEMVIVLWVGKSVMGLE